MKRKFMVSALGALCVLAVGGVFTALAAGGYGSQDDPLAVSYTHLDVYKRQVLSRRGAGKGDAELLVHIAGIAGAVKAAGGGTTVNIRGADELLGIIHNAAGHRCDGGLRSLGCLLYTSFLFRR